MTVAIRATFFIDASGVAKTPLEAPISDRDERCSGALVTLYHGPGDHFKVGVGHDFTDFSGGPTDPSDGHPGLFPNAVGTF